jgi:hypothetical protein
MTESNDSTWEEEYHKCMADVKYFGEKYSVVRGDTIYWDIPDELKIAAFNVECGFVPPPSTGIQSGQRMINRLLDQIGREY